jgi:hypothetical protein
MATLLAVVGEEPAPMVAAGPLEPVLRGLLTKDPAARTTAAGAREQLAAVAAGPPDPAPRRARPRLGIRSPGGGDVVRFDLADLLSLASSSKAVLSTAVRDARDQVKEANERRHEPPLPRRERRAAAKQRRFRFKRRWVVVPMVLLVLVVVLVLATLALLVTGVITLS